MRGISWIMCKKSAFCCRLITTPTHTHTHPFHGPLSRTTQVSRYQKGTTNRDFTEARDSEWQWHQLGHMQVCTSLQTDNHASTPPLVFLQAGCSSCRPTNSVKALKATNHTKKLSDEVLVLTTPTPRHLIFYRLGGLPDTQQTFEGKFYAVE